MGFFREQQGKGRLECDRGNEVEGVVEDFAVSYVVVPLECRLHSHLADDRDEQLAAQEVHEVGNDHHCACHDDAHMGIHVHNIGSVLFYHLVVQYFNGSAASHVPR